MELDERRKKRAKRHTRDKYHTHYVGRIGYGPIWNNGALYPSTDPTKQKQCPATNVETSTSDTVAMGENIDLKEKYDIVNILRDCVYKWFSFSSSPDWERCFILPNGVFVPTPNGGPHFLIDLSINRKFNYALETGDISEFTDHDINITIDQIKYILNKLETLSDNSNRKSGSDILEDLLGAIRCNGGKERYLVVDQEIPPTPKQYEALKLWLIKYYEQANESISVHTSGSQGGASYDSTTQWLEYYPYKSSVEDIIKNIKRFYVIGELRENKTEEMQAMKYDIKNAFKALKDIEEEDVQQPTKFERKPLAEKYIKKPLKEAVTKLEPRFDSRKSFYGKARVDVKDDGTKVLWSYNTPVCRIKDGKVTLLRRRYLGWDSSQTTLRHVKDFLKQNGFEAGSYKEIAKMYPEEEASIDEGLTEDWKGPQIVEPGSKEYKNLQLACDILNQDSVNDISYKLEPTYFDYGQKWEYTAIIAYDPKGNIWGGSWQVGSPRNWEEIVNADSEEEVRAAIDDLKKGEYFRDVPADFPKHNPIKNYNLNKLDHVEDWNGFAIYKVDDKYTINPNITRKRFDTLDELKKFLTKRYNIKEAVDGEEKLAFEWFANELEVNKNLWDEENHAYDIDKVNELIDSQTEWDKDMLHWFFKQMGELDDTGYDYDSFVVLCGHYNNDKSLKEATNIDLGNKEDLDKAREILDDNVEEETKEVIVDVDADSVDALKKSYAGQIILQCQKCFTPRFISAEELVKTEDKDEDGHSIYNIEDECSQCGEKAGYIVVGQVSKYDSEASKEAEEENGDVEGETPVDSIEPDMDILFDEEPEIEEESFNRIFTNYLTETYDNVVSFKLESGTFENREFVFEGVVEFKSGKTRDIKLVLEGKKVNNILMLESVNDNITYEHKSFVVEALIEGNKFTTKSLRYSYKAADQLVEGLIQ